MRIISTTYRQRDNEHRIRDIPGNAGTAAKLQTTRTIALAGGVTGSASFNGSANATITAIDRGGTIGQSGGTDTATNCWFKLASVSVNGTNLDENIVLLLTKPYAAKSTWGILYCGVRTDGTNGYYSSGVCLWLVQSGMILANFVLAYQPSVKPFLTEIWVRCPGGWENYFYTVLEEGKRSPRSRTDWTLVNALTTGSTAITSGYSLITSANGTLANAVSGNAATATKLATARTVALTGDAAGSASFDGSANASIATTLATVSTAGTTGETANKTLTYGGTFITPQLTIDAKGRTTAVTARTLTMPAAPIGVRSYLTTLSSGTQWEVDAAKIWTFTFVTPLPTANYNATLSLASSTTAKLFVPYVYSLSAETLVIGFRNISGAIVASGTVATVRAMVFYW
jgi:hypothetical protein